MRLAADIVFEPHVVAQRVDEARLPVPAVVLWIVDGDDVLELRRADAADALDGAQFVGKREGKIAFGAWLLRSCTSGIVTPKT